MSTEYRLSWEMPPPIEVAAIEEWARTREQPIRNVVLEQRDAPTPDEGWALSDA